MKFLEIRMKVPDSVPNKELEDFGKHLQELLPTEFWETCSDDGSANSVEDVTFEIKEH